MKPFLLSIFALFLFAVPHASAHTYLSETSPQDGATVTENVQEIVLTFEGKIEEGSTFNVIAQDGTEYSPSATTLVDGVLTGTFEQPLANDVYTVKWNSISQDGHPLSGEFGFTVNAAVEKQPENTVVEETEPAKEAEPIDTTERVKDQDIEKSNSPFVLVGGLLLVVLLVSVITLLKRKKAQ